jgi:thymidine phosphorylase
MDSWNAMIRAQGGDPAAPLPVSPHRHSVAASASGRVTRMDALAVGVAAWRLGAGRARKEDAVSFGAGVQMHAKPGDIVTAGSPLFTLHADDEARFDRALEALTAAVDIAAADAEWSKPALVLERVGA